jgi:NADH-quinone oxidoreductase subunit M
MFSSIGLPGLNGFVGEFFIFRGVFGLAPWAAAVGCLGLFATAFFYLTFWQRVFHGPRAGAAVARFAEVKRSELAVLIPLTALMLLLGILPQLLTRLFNPLITAWATGFTP